MNALETTRPVPRFRARQWARRILDRLAETAPDESEPTLQPDLMLAGDGRLFVLPAWFDLDPDTKDVDVDEWNRQAAGYAPGHISFRGANIDPAPDEPIAWTPIGWVTEWTPPRPPE